MAVPKKRISKTRQLKRRSQIFLEGPTLTKCQKCGKPILPHSLCPFCGYYKGRVIVDLLAKLDKKERKKREKEMAEKKEETMKKSP